MSSGCSYYDGSDGESQVIMERKLGRLNGSNTGFSRDSLKRRWRTEESFPISASLSSY